MIKKIKMFTVICNNCKKQWVDEDNGLTAMTDKSSMIDVIEEDSDWHVEGDKHYCPDCYKGFDEDDNLLINMDRRK